MAHGHIGGRSAEQRSSDVATKKRIGSYQPPTHIGPQVPGSAAPFTLETAEIFADRILCFPVDISSYSAATECSDVYGVNTVLRFLVGRFRAYRAAGIMLIWTLLEFRIAGIRRRRRRFLSEEEPVDTMPHAPPARTSITRRHNHVPPPGNDASRGRIHDFRTSRDSRRSSSRRASQRERQLRYFPQPAVALRNLEQ